MGENVLRFKLPMFLLVLIASAAAYGQEKPIKHAWMDKSLSSDARADLIVGQMTLDEKLQMVHGAGLPVFGPTDPSIVRSNGGGGFVPGVERLDVPDLNMADSAIGVGLGAKKGRYSTVMPSALALASSWDLNLANEFGALIGQELNDQGFNVSLGGGVDIMREPRNGRNFEYMGEDPVLAGNMAAQWIQGIQAQHVIGDVKHYAVNDSETGRYFSNSVIDKRALRETDLLAFEIAVKKGKPDMVMCSYNLVNGVHACENSYVLTEVLKKEWGFQGWVISDWFGTHSTSRAALAGLDQEEPGFVFFGPPLKKAVESGEVPLSRLNDMVHRILRTEIERGLFDNPGKTGVPDIAKGFEVAQKVEEHSAVLLKNSGRLLPLSSGALKSIAVIGSHADLAVLSGGGSAQVDPPGGNAVLVKTDPADILSSLTAPVWDPSSPLRAIRASAPRTRVDFDAGTDIASAVQAAKKAEIAVVFAHQHTHEGNDVLDLSLPDNQDRLISAVAAVNPHTIVVLETGGPVTMPWLGQVSAVLEAWYPGIRGGEAIAAILFGDVNPSGKLAAGFARNEADLPRPDLPRPPGPLPTALDGVLEPRQPFDVNYFEGLEVGYKWFDGENKTPLFPFGYGLSYTSFAYSHMKASAKPLEISFDVKNTGDRAGEEIAQVYVSFPQSVKEPPKRLVGWEKVPLSAGETKTIVLKVDPLYVSIFDVTENSWKLVPGDYKFLAGPSSRELPLTAQVSLGQ